MPHARNARVRRFSFFNVHLFTHSVESAHKQRIKCEGFTLFAFTESSHHSSPQPFLLERVTTKVKGEHRKLKLGEVRVRDRDAHIRVSYARKKAKARSDFLSPPRQHRSPKRELNKVRNEDEKVPLFCDKPPHFFEKDVAFSQQFFRRHDKVQCLFTKFCTKRKAGRRNSLHFVGTSTKNLYFCRKTFAAAATLCRPSPPI